MRGKTIRIKKPTENTKSIKIPQMMSIDEMRKILNDEGELYNDDELKILRDFIPKRCEIIYREFIQQQKLLNNSINNYDKESYPLHQSEYRRAS